MNILSISKGVNSILKNKNPGLIEILIHPGKSSLKEKKLWESHSQHLYYTKKERFNELVLSQNKKIRKIIS